MGNDRIAEKLAQLEPHGASDMPGSGQPGGSRTELAAYLHGLSRFRTLLIWARYINARSVQGRLWYEAELVVTRMAARRKWFLDRGDPLRGTEILRRMTRLAIMELVEPFRCPRCKGTGINRSNFSCRQCGGTGNSRPLSERGRARLMHVPWTTWDRTWSGRYHLIVRHMAGQGEKALRQIRRNMRP